MIFFIDETIVYFQSRERDSISHSVGRSVGPLVRPSVHRSVAVHEARDFWRLALFIWNNFFYIKLDSDN